MIGYISLAGSRQPCNTLRKKTTQHPARRRAALCNIDGAVMQQIRCERSLTGAAVKSIASAAGVCS